MSEAIIEIDSIDDLVDAWRRVDADLNGAVWKKAEIAASASVRGKYGKVKEFAERVEVGERTIRKLAATFETFPESGQRCPHLPFTHHLRAATLARDQAETISARTGPTARGRRGGAPAAISRRALTRGFSRSASTKRTSRSLADGLVWIGAGVIYGVAPPRGA